MVTIAEGLDGGLDDVLGRLEIRLADAEIDDILALALQFGRARQNLECRFRSQPLQIRHELQHGASPHKPRPSAAGANGQGSAPEVLSALTNSRSRQRRKAR